MEADAGTDKTIQIFIGSFLKNETGNLIKRRTYHLERKLGAPDDTQPTQIQCEYVKGAVANEFTLTVATADKITCNFGFVATDHEVVAGTTGPKSGTRASIVDADAWNTSSNFNFMRMSVVNPSNNSPTGVFAYVTDLEVTVNNNAEPNKAVAVMGAFDVSVGTFDVSASVTAYFQSVAALQALRANADMQLCAALAKDNQGWVFDIPLITPSGGQAEVEQDAAIMVPMEANAATAAKLAADMDHTLSWTFFYYLPNFAG
jgi:hypothetical protein